MVLESDPLIAYRRRGSSSSFVGLNVDRLMLCVREILKKPKRVNTSAPIPCPWTQKTTRDNKGEKESATHDKVPNATMHSSKMDEDDDGDIGNFIQIRGDLLSSKEQFICHQTNCRTGHALGLAKHIFNKWPHANCYAERQPWKKNTVYSKPGTADIRRGSRGIINMMGQDMPGKYEKDDQGRKLNSHATKQLRLSFFESVLDEIAAVPDLKSLAFPYQVGCGLAGGDWETYRARLMSLAKRRPDVKIVVYRLPDRKEAAFKRDVAHDK